MDNMKITTVYKCMTCTEATDRANLFYINSKTARQLERERDTRQIRVLGRNGYILAIFTY